MSVYYCYSVFCLIFASFVCIDRQDLLESLVLSIILNQIQTFFIEIATTCSCIAQF